MCMLYLIPSNYRFNIVRTHCLGPCVVYKFDLSLVLIALIMGIPDIATAAELNFLFMGNSTQLSI